MYVIGILGLVLGSMDVDYVFALPVLVLMIGLTTTYRLIFGGADDSKYQLYLANFVKRQPLPPRPWIGYTAVMFMYGAVVGTVTFALGSFFL